MSISAIWDRFWWSLMLTILLGLIWLKAIDPFVPCVSVGLIVCIGAGVAYFGVGIRAMARQVTREKEIEQKAREELVAEFGKDAVQ
jgi:hypothetical protein